MADFDPTEMAADFAEMHAGLAQSAVVFSGKGRKPQTVAAVIGDAANGSRGSDEGLIGEDAVSLTVLASAFTVTGGWVPADGDTVRIEGVSYRLLPVRHTPGDVVYMFNCEAVNK